MAASKPKTMTVATIEARLDAALARRKPLLDHCQGDLDAVRLVNGAGDGLAGVHVDQLGPVLLAHAEEGCAFGPIFRHLLERKTPQAVYLRVPRKNVREAAPEELVPMLLFATGERLNDEQNQDELQLRERELRFLVRPRDGYSHGLFLDQRENRARVLELTRSLVKQRAGYTVLNTFAYTCAFSVAAAKAGALTTSVDLSARYLGWGHENFALNGLDVGAHEFAKGDAVTYLEIAAKKGRKFDLLILDPPTFATSKKSGVFQVERHYEKLFTLAARAAAPAASVLCSHNQRTFTRAALATKLRAAARASGRKIEKLTPFSPPPDFPGSETQNPAARGFWVELD